MQKQERSEPDRVRGVPQLLNPDWGEVEVDAVGRPVRERCGPSPLHAEEADVCRRCEPLNPFHRIGEDGDLCEFNFCFHI